MYLKKNIYLKKATESIEAKTEKCAWSLGPKLANFLKGLHIFLLDHAQHNISIGITRRKKNLIHFY